MKLACFTVVRDVSSVVRHVYDVEVSVEVCTFSMGGGVPYVFFVVKVV